MSHVSGYRTAVFVRSCSVWRGSTISSVKLVSEASAEPIGERPFHGGTRGELAASA